MCFHLTQISIISTTHIYTFCSTIWYKSCSLLPYFRGTLNFFWLFKGFLLKNFFNKLIVKLFFARSCSRFFPSFPSCTNTVDWEIDWFFQRNNFWFYWFIPKNVLLKNVMIKTKISLYNYYYNPTYFNLFSCFQENLWSTSDRVRAGGSR